MSKERLNILTPIGMLGYGIPEQWLRKGLELGPDAITVDAGSTDSGPQKLALGSMTCSEDAYRKDISLLLEACHHTRTPVYISSAGGAGTNDQVDFFVDLVASISAARGYSFRLASIHAEIDPATIKRHLREGRVSPLGPVPPLTEAEIDAAPSIVAQMGAEPFLKVFEEAPGIDIIIAGRAYDPAPLAAVGLHHGFDPALCWHMGKIMECGAACAIPNGQNIFGTLTHSHFELEPVNPAERCTRRSVAAHTLYEKSHPFLLAGPGGTLDLSGCEYEQVDDRRVRVSGSRFQASEGYSIKLEGAKRVGFRSVFIGGVRDPGFIEHLDGILARVREDIRTFFSDIDPASYQVIFHVYGRNGVMGAQEPVKSAQPHELCIVVEVAAGSQQLATAICGKVRTKLAHISYPGKVSSGNIAWPFTPLEIPLGEVCEFNVYHLMAVESPTDLFPIRYREI